MLDFPEITESPATAPAPQPAATEQTRAITASIGVVQGEVAKFDQIAAGLAAIEAAHPKNVIVAAIETPAGMKLAEASWRAYRNPRLEVERARKAAKAPVLALGKAIDTFAGSLEDRLREGETHYKAQIDREEERRAAIRAEQERIEREAAERHAARRAAISMYLMRAQEPGMTSERIERGMQILRDADVTDPDAARAVELADLQCRTLESMRLLHAQAVAREQEAARQEAIRIENERVAAELAAERARIAAEAEAVRRQAAELAAREQAAREAEQRQRDEAAAAELLRQARELKERQDSERRAEQAAMTYPNGAPMYGQHIKENGDLVMLDDQGKRSIFCDVDEGAADASPSVGAVILAGLHGAARAGQTADAATAADLMLQDECRDLIIALATKPDAMQHAREAAQAIEAPAPRVVLLTAEPDPADAELPVLLSHIGKAFESRFPTQPNMSKEWWAELRAMHGRMVGAA